VKDLRLAPAALGCWAAALAMLFLGWWAGLALVSVGLAVIYRPWRWIAATALLGVLLGLAATCARLPDKRLAAQPVSSVLLVVDDDPRPARSVTGRDPTWVIPATVAYIDPVSAPPSASPVADASRGAPAASGAVQARVVVLAQDPRWRGLLPGQHVRATVRFGPSRGGDLTAATLSATDPPILVGAPPWWQTAAGHIRAGLQKACEPLDRLPGGLLPGLVVGDTSRLDPALAQQFREVGLTHLVAVSGSNVALIIGAVVLIARWARLRPQWTAAVAAIALVGLVILVRPSPSVLRAAVMGGVGLLALAGGRGRAALPALCAAITALLVLDPALASDAGFALSVLATGGLLLLAPPMRDALRRWRLPGGVAEALAVPAAAQVACAPVIAGLSATVSIVAVPANLLAVPAIAPATFCGVAAAMLSPVWPGAAQFAAWLGSWPCWWLVKVAQIGSAIPGGALPWPGGLGGGLLLALVTIVVLAGVRSRAARRIALLITLATVVGAVRLVAPGWPPPGWLIAMCDVGQGDAVVLRAGEGSAVVVDTGPTPAPVASCLGDLAVTRVPLLVVTHYHLDHIGGLQAVLDLRPGRLLAPAFHEPPSSHDAVLRSAASAGVPVVEVGGEAVWTVGEVTLRVLPVPPLSGTRSDPNNNSTVLLATTHGVRVLLLGDAETEEQALVRAAYPGLAAEVLKVAHHGSSYQDVSLLDEVRPTIALVSVGAGNDYGHPNVSLLDHLRRNGSRVLRTDLDGAIAVALDQGHLVVVHR
jgi:competence protein ComEC